MQIHLNYSWKCCVFPFKIITERKDDDDDDNQALRFHVPFFFFTKKQKKKSPKVFGKCKSKWFSCWLVMAMINIIQVFDNNFSKTLFKRLFWMVNASRVF